MQLHKTSVENCEVSRKLCNLMNHIGMMSCVNSQHSVTQGGGREIRSYHVTTKLFSIWNLPDLKFYSIPLSSV